MDIRPALPLAFWTAQMAANQNSGAVNGTFTTITFATDVLTFPNAIIDKPTTAQLRALIPGYYRAQYRLSHFNTGNANPRGLEARILLNNATPVTDSESASQAGNSAAVVGIISASPIILMAANDFVEVQVAPLSGVAHTVVATYGTFRLELLRLT